jgi:hypothetical protein
VPPAGSVLRRALLIWGWGHLTLGDRRGWLLVALQPLAVASLLLVAWQLIDGTRWLAVFVPLVVLVVFWVAQAVHAYRRALALGGAPGGELQLALFLPLVLAVFTAFWLLGGRHGSAASTVEAYMEAWQAGRPDVATALYSPPTLAQNDVATFWHVEHDRLVTEIGAAQAQYGLTSGLDSARPFSSLRVTQTSDSSTFVVELVRSETYQTTLLGLIPTAGQRTVVVAQVMTIWVTEAGVPGWLPSSVWRIAGVQEAEAV